MLGMPLLPETVFVQSDQTKLEIPSYTESQRAIGNANVTIYLPLS